MSSKASVRNYLDSAKSVKSSKSAKSAKSGKDRISAGRDPISAGKKEYLPDLASKIGGRVSAINRVRKDAVEFVTDKKDKLIGPIKRVKAADQEKIPVTFENICNFAPKNTWIGYELNRTYRDRSGELCRVYSNSAFYKGCYQRSSHSVQSKEKVTEDIIIVLSGKREWHLSKSDIHRIFIYKYTDFANIDFAKRVERRIAESRSKSLTHNIGKDAKDSKDKVVKSKTSTRSTTDKSKRLSGGTIKPSETNKKLLTRPRSLAH
jgi:hypothetical protein